MIIRKTSVCETNTVLEMILSNIYDTQLSLCLRSEVDILIRFMNSSDF